jgi:hypothetical protein
MLLTWTDLFRLADPFHILEIETSIPRYTYVSNTEDLPADWEPTYECHLRISIQSISENRMDAEKSCGVQQRFVGCYSSKSIDFSRLTKKRTGEG